MLNASKATWCNGCEAGKGDYCTGRMQYGQLSHATIAKFLELWSDAGAGYLPNRSNEVKVWELACVKVVERVLVRGLLWLGGNFW